MRELNLQTFIRFIQYVVGITDSFDEELSPKAWRELYEECQRQTITAWCFNGIERLGKDQRPPREILLQWYALTERVCQANGKVNADAVAASRLAQSEGYRSCLLKGQGLAQLYPNPLRRMPGDIDLWVEGGHANVVPFVRRHFPSAHMSYHHANINESGRTCLEIHFLPIWMSSPVANSRLQRWFRRHADQQFSNHIALSDGAGDICVPTPAFNAVYVLLHIFRHLLEEGVGLRQVTDYYYCILQLDEPARLGAYNTLKHLGLGSFTASVMYVLGKVYGLSEEKQLCSPDERRGEKLLGEIMYAGNFGHYDRRNRGNDYNSSFGRFRATLIRNQRFLTDYPFEVICDPLMKIKHFVWRSIAPLRWHHSNN